MDYAGALQICTVQSTGYGNKRLLRHREYLVATPLPYIAGEPNYLSDLTGFNAPTNSLCDPSDVSSGVSNLPTTMNAWISSANSVVSLYYNSTTSLNRFDALPNLSYFIGSPATSQCRSRFGIQDPLGMGVIFSDRFTRTNSTTITPATLQASINSNDTGAVDFGDLSIDGTLAPAFLTNNGTYSYYYSSIYSQSTSNSCTKLGTPPVSFIPAIGTPICTWTGNTQNLRSIATYEASGALGTYAITGGGKTANWLVSTDTGYSSYQMASGINGRFSALFVTTAGGSSNSRKYGNVFCAVEAE